MDTRNNTIDIARGIAIILVVIGHSGICEYPWNIIFFFHMPLFFFISGCFFKPLDNWSVIEYLKRLKWKRVYKTFVQYSLLFLTATPILYYYGLSNTHIDSFSNLLKSIELILRFRTATVDLLNTFWFMPVLFFTHAFALLLTQIFKSKKWIILTILIIYLIGRYCFVNGYKEPYDFSRILYLSSFYLLGYCSYPYLKMMKRGWYVPLLSFAIILILSLIPNLVFNIEILYLLAALSGILITIHLSMKLEKGKTTTILKVMGKHTMGIYIFHPLIMKITELCLAQLGLVVYTTGWPGANPITNYWWLFTFMGIIIPIIFIKLRPKFRVFTKIAYNNK